MGAAERQVTKRYLKPVQQPKEASEGSRKIISGANRVISDLEIFVSQNKLLSREDDELIREAQLAALSGLSAALKDARTIVERDAAQHSTLPHHTDTISD